MSAQESPTPARAEALPAKAMSTMELITLFGEIAGRAAMYDTQAMHNRFWEIRHELERRVVMEDALVASSESGFGSHSRAKALDDKHQAEWNTRVYPHEEATRLAADHCDAFRVLAYDLERELTTERLSKQSATGFCKCANCGEPMVASWHCYECHGPDSV